ncbi:MAG: hypothetical protein KGJ13_04970 [Patescibacteria group bacterium]|nr:hypothetical protein [Patescibacteria group bacterium]
MARQKTEKSKAQTAFENARKAYADAKAKLEKSPANETLKKAAAHAHGVLAEAAKEAARDRFLRIGALRVEKAVTALAALRKVANPRSYRFTDKDIERMTAELAPAFESTVQAFQSALKNPHAKTEEKRKFSFE